MNFFKRIIKLVSKSYIPEKYTPEQIAKIMEEDKEFEISDELKDFAKKFTVYLKKKVFMKRRHKMKGFFMELARLLEKYDATIIPINYNQTNRYEGLEVQISGNIIPLCYKFIQSWTLEHAHKSMEEQEKIARKRSKEKLLKYAESFDW